VVWEGGNGGRTEDVRELVARLVEQISGTGLVKDGKRRKGRTYCTFASAISDVCGVVVDDGAKKSMRFNLRDV